MDKRVFLTVVLCMGILLAWQRFFPSPPPVPPTTTPMPAQGPSVAAATPTPAVPTAGTPARPPTVRPPEIVERIEHEGSYRAQLSSYGAAPTSWILLHPQYQEEIPRDGRRVLEPINLVRTKSPTLPFVITFPESDFTLEPDAAWNIAESASADDKRFTWDDARVHLEKRFTFVPGSYEVKLVVTIANKSDKPLAEHLELEMAGWHDPTIKAGGFFSRRVLPTEGVCDLNGKLKKSSLEGLLKSPIDEVGQVRWVGISEQYFVAAAALEGSVEDKRCRVSAQPDGTISSTVRFAERRIAAGQTTEYHFVAFLGPKILSELDRVIIGGVDAKLGDSIDYGWLEAIARPMLVVLQTIHKVVPNWGLAIIALTLLLKAATWWPMMKQMKSMKAMAKLKPEMDRLKTKYGEDKQKLNLEVMNLYKQHGINPLGGCLPMLIQMPIWFALYAVLGKSVELYRSNFFGWIHDLTAPDPYYVLPLATGAFMFLQQRFSPTPPDPQQKMMMYMMPVMFTVMGIFFPSGLAVYILTNTVLTMVQQWWMNRDQPRRPQVATKPARAS